MRNVVDIDLSDAVPKLAKAMDELSLTLKELDDMDYQGFCEFCAQLDEGCLNLLDGIVINWEWKLRIFSVLDGAALLGNRYK